MYYRIKLQRLEAKREKLLETNQKLYALAFDLPQCCIIAFRALDGNTEAIDTIKRLKAFIEEMQGIAIAEQEIREQELQRRRQKQANHFHFTNYYSFTI